MNHTYSRQSVDSKSSDTENGDVSCGRSVDADNVSDRLDMRLEEATSNASTEHSDEKTTPVGNNKMFAKHQTRKPLLPPVVPVPPGAPARTDPVSPNHPRPLDLARRWSLPVRLDITGVPKRVPSLSPNEPRPVGVAQRLRTRSLDTSSPPPPNEGELSSEALPDPSPRVSPIPMGLPH